jgi:hypothetical protein
LSSASTFCRPQAVGVLAFGYGSGLLVHVSNTLLPTRDIRLEKASHTSKQLGSNKRGCAMLHDEERFSLEKGAVRLNERRGPE